METKYTIESTEACLYTLRFSLAQQRVKLKDRIYSGIEF